MSCANVRVMKASVALGAPWGQRVCRGRRVFPGSQERRALLASVGLLDRVDLRGSRVVLGSEERRATEAAEETGAMGVRTDWTALMENRD